MGIRPAFRNVGRVTPFFKAWARVYNATERIMKYVLGIVAAASICAALPASAEEVGVGVRELARLEPVLRLVRITATAIENEQP